MIDHVCIMCGASGPWKNVDEFRFKPQGMHMCMNCAFITYPERCKKTESIKDHYRAGENRPKISSNNVFSGERKLHFHINFLDDLFTKWKSDNKNPVVLEVGAAMGMFLNWIKAQFPESDLNGTELTVEMRRVAHWLYKVNLGEEPDQAKKYDLICSYKVAEHMPDVREQFAKYHEALSDDGSFYVSVPTWFGRLNNPGLPGLDLEFYYDPDHVNIWSRAQFETLLVRSGFEITKRDYTYYDSTYLCKKAKPINGVTLESSEKRLEQLSKILEAAKHGVDGDFDKAFSVWPDFPSAHVNNYEKNRAKFHHNGFAWIKEEILDRASKDCPDCYYTLFFAGDISSRYEQWDDAVKYFNKAIDTRPMDALSLISTSQVFRSLANRTKDNHDKIKLLKEASSLCALVEQNCSQQRWDAVNWLLYDASRIPIPGEASRGD